MEPDASPSRRGTGRPGPSRGSKGFILLPLIFVIAIVLVSATVIVASDVVIRTRARIQTGITALKTIEHAIVTFDTTVVDPEAKPDSLTHLTVPITTKLSNICGYNYSIKNTRTWKGPYLDRVVPPEGFPIGIGIVLSDLVRNRAKVPLNQSNTDKGELYVTVVGVREGDAIKVDTEIDAGDGSAKGKVRWGAVDQEGLTTLTYVLPIVGC